MKHRTLNLAVALLGGLLSASSFAFDFRFQVAEPQLGCKFAGPSLITSVMTQGIVSVDVNVTCLSAQRYYFNTDLAKGHVVHTPSGRWHVSSALTNTGKRCTEALDAPANAFYEDSNAGGREGTGSQSWRLCVGMRPLDGQIQTVPPVEGVVMVTLQSSPTLNYPEGTLTYDTLFAHDGVMILPESDTALRHFMSTLDSSTAYRFELHAHASDHGDAKYNYALSIRRLAAVRASLSRHFDIKDQHIWGQAWGEQRLKALNAGESFAAQNRRVSIVAIPVPAPISPGLIPPTVEPPISPGLIPPAQAKPDPAVVEVIVPEPVSDFIERKKGG